MTTLAERRRKRIEALKYNEDWHDKRASHYRDLNARLEMEQHRRGAHVCRATALRLGWRPLDTSVIAREALCHLDNNLVFARFHRDSEQ